MSTKFSQNAINSGSNNVISQPPIRLRLSGDFSFDHTPIFKYKPELFSVKENPRKACESIRVEIRAPDKPTHRKVIKLNLEEQKTDILNKAGNQEKHSVAKDFIFDLKRKNRSSIQWAFTERDVKPIIKGKKVNKFMKEALYGVKLKSPLKHNLGFDPYKVYNFGEPGCGTWRGVVQDFVKIRDYHLKKGTLFVDPLFPAATASITYSGKFPKCYWARPTEMIPDAKLFIKGFSRFDVNQGLLGDCWFLASLATLTQRHNLFLQVVPLDQSFTDKYAGVFHFRFWQFGRWVDIVVDDRLPVNVKGELLFTKSTSKKEFWPALLEKAYAKLHGSYEALAGGVSSEAMEDFTGGITESYELKSAPANLFNIMKRAFIRGSLITMTIERKEGEPAENVTEMGLVQGHAYTITRVLQTKIKIGYKISDVQLVRLRNPWGGTIEDWKGAWGNRSKEWLLVSNEEKERVGLNFDHDGEFWMSFSDFKQHATFVDLCNLSPSSSGRSRKWEVMLFEGEWVNGVTAGGCPNFDKTFASNPQYLITLDEYDEKNSNTCTILVDLMQKRKTRTAQMGINPLHIGFVIYAVPNPESAPKPLTRKYLYDNEIADYCDYESSRTVSKRLELQIGTYCIIPSTFEPNQSGEFVLRVFSERKVEMHENEEEVGLCQKKRICMCAPIETHVSYHSIEEEVVKESDSVPETGPDVEPTPPETSIRKGDGVPSDEVLPKTKEKHPEPPKIIPDKTVIPDNIEKVSFISDTIEALSDEIASLSPDEVLKEMRSSRIISNNPLTQKEIESRFLLLSGDDEEINWEHLQILLDIAFRNNPNYKMFSCDLCRCLVALYDENQSGKLFYEEFARLCRDVAAWTAIFYKHTPVKPVQPPEEIVEEEEQVLSGTELRYVINEAGFTINNHILNLVFHRYGNGIGGIVYEDVLMCLIRIKSMLTGFNVMSFVDTEPTEFTLEYFMNLVMYS